MRVVIAGLGSIGRRHLDAFRAVRADGEYAIWRSGTGDPAEIDGVAEFHSAADVESFAPDLVVVCTPTARHAATVTEAAAFAPALLVEKPLAHTSDDLKAIVAQVEKSDCAFFHAAVLRHHPLLVRTRELLADESPLSYSLYCGSWLPDWRPGRDYRELYSARAELGGGVATDLIHEFDYAEWLFGPVATINGLRAHVSELEIDVDDLCLADMEHAQGVLGQIQLSYFRRTPRRDFEIVCSDVVLHGDLLAGRLLIGDREEMHPASTDQLMQLQASAVLDALERGDGGDNVHAVADLAAQVISIPSLVDARR